MKSKLPIRKIATLNLGLSINTILFVFILQMLTAKGDRFAVILTHQLIGFIALLLITFGNLALFLIFERLPQIKKSRIRVYFLICSYTFSVFTSLLTTVLYLVFVDASANITPLSLLLISFLCFLVNTNTLVLQHYVIIQDEKYRIDMENSQLKAIYYESANQLLKQQIQPHFLFNALTILKSLYKSDTREGEKYLIHLSSFLRATLSKDNIRITKVAEEIALCENYVNMQKVRFGQALNYSVQLSEHALKNCYVPSFSIQTLIENAIKHNELTEQQPLSIEISESGDWIKVYNKVKLKNTSPESTGIGLSNLSERYRLLAGEAIRIEQTADDFSVSIKMLDSRAGDKFQNQKS